MEDITRILNELVARPERPSDDLVNAIYDELRQMAAAKMAHERVGTYSECNRACSRSVSPFGWQFDDLAVATAFLRCGC